MLRFLLGKSGTGKTSAIHKMITEYVGKGKRVLLLVPDQRSFESEKALLDLLGAGKAREVLVCGFSGLCRYVFEKSRTLTSNVIDEGTRAVVMSLAIEQLSEKLSLLNTGSTRAVTELMLQTLVTCKQYCITTDMLRQCANKIDDDTLRAKLNETALIIDTYDALVSQSYIDPLDDMQRLTEILAEHPEILDGYSLFIDSFTSFSKVQLTALRQLLGRCTDTYIALTLDPESDGNEEIFAPSHNTYKLLKDLAKRDSLEIKAPLKFTTYERYTSESLSQLEAGIFRAESKSYDTIPDNMSVHIAKNFYSECEFVAKEIKRLIINEGMLYSDIAVICHDISSYRGILNTILDKYEIPYFMDVPKDIEVKPIIRFVTSLFRIILDGCQRDDVVSLLKTGLTQNSLEEISCFENYLYVWNVKGSEFKNEFTKNPDGFAEKFTSDSDKALKTAEKVRKSIIEPVLSFKAEIADCTCREITTKLYQLICDLKVPDALREMYDVLENGEEKGRGAEQIRLWNMLMEIFDKMVASAGDIKLSAKRYFELLSLQLNHMKLSEIPQSYDSVSVTTADRVMLSEQKVSFVIGCIDGQFPKVPKISGVFTASERRMLTNAELEFGDDLNSSAQWESFIAYCSVTSPSDRLFLSYPTGDYFGGSYQSSSIITEAFRIFPNIKVTYDDDYSDRESSMLSEQSAFEAFARDFSNDDTSGGLYEYFSENEKYRHRLKAVERAVFHKPFEIEDTENVKKLFGENLNISASQLEKFSLCRFAYFCNYGLRVRERLRAEINPMEYGTLVHYVLEKFFTENDRDAYSQMGEDKIEVYVSGVLADYTQRFYGDREQLTNVFKYRLSVISDGLVSLIKHIVNGLLSGSFDVADCELRIGEEIPAYSVELESGQSVSVRGSIDRVDVMEKDGKKYLRIVDYKTGNKDFVLSDILYGLNLQMLLYLCCVNKNGTDRYGQIIPSGILYMPATAPSVSASKTDAADKAEKDFVKELRMNGLILKDLDAVEGMESDGMARFIPVSIKSGMLKESSSLATLEQLGSIFAKIDETIKSMGDDLYGGNIIAQPLKGKHDSCKYCPYDSVCAYRMSEPVNTLKLDNKKVYEMLMENGGEEDGKNMD